MNNITEIKTLPYSVSELFDLVMDVEKYPEFLPWVSDTKIISKSDNELVADMVINFASISQSYRSEIKYDILENSSFIEVVAISGPFKKLYNLWKFTAANEGTLVEFKIDFEFKTSLFSNIAAGVFKSVLQKMITAFEKRALEKYGSNKNPK